MSEDDRKDKPDSRSVAFECDLPEPVDKVWRALTTREIVSEWLLPTDLKAEKGARFTLSEPAKEPIDCEIISIEEQRSIRFGWRDAEARRDGLSSTVTFEIAATESGGTRLTIVHEVRYAAQPAHAPATACLAANDNSAAGLRLAA